MSLESGLADFYLDSQMTLEAVFPGVLVIDGGSDIPCARSAEELRFAGALGGDEDEEEVVIRVRTSLVDESNWVRGRKVTLDGKVMRVEEACLMSGDVAYHVRLGPEGV